MTSDIATKPFSRNRSRIVVVPGEFVGRPRAYEVQVEEWLSRSTGRYRRVWSARQKGDLGWHTGRSVRKALARAAYVREGQRPRWLSAAAALAEESLR